MVSKSERYENAARWLQENVTSAPGRLDARTRHAAFERARAYALARELPALPAPLAIVVDKVARRPVEVTDADIASLHAAGLDEHAAFELVVAAAAGAGLARREAGLAALRGRA